MAHLNGKCSNDLQKVRSIFRWLCTRDLSTVTSQGDDVSDDAPVANVLVEMREATDSSNKYAKLFARMCKCAIRHTCNLLGGGGVHSVGQLQLTTGCN